MQAFKISRFLAAAVLVLIAASTGLTQRAPVLHGRVLDSAGTGAQATVVVQSAEPPQSELGRAATAADGSFRVTLSTLPARIAVSAIVNNETRALLTLDSAVVATSQARPIILRLNQPQKLAEVKVTARYQRRPSMSDYLYSEPASRTDPIGNLTSDYVDPLALGGLDALLAASPELLLSADGGMSALGAPTGSNQLQIADVQMPGSMVTGMLTGDFSVSPWDASIGGAAGATVNLYLPAASRFKNSYAILRSGAAGVPSWLDSPGSAGGLSLPLLGGIGTTGPLGRFGYRLYAFGGETTTSLRHWDALLHDDERFVLDSISGLSSEPTFRRKNRSIQGGAFARFDFVPHNSKKLLALSGGLTRSRSDGGTEFGFVTGSGALRSVEDAAFLQVQSSRVVHQRVLWKAILSGALSRNTVEPTTIAPRLLVSDTALGNVLVTGGAHPRSANRIASLEGRTNWTWYSIDNRVRYSAQLQSRLAFATVGSRAPFSTFGVESIEALGAGRAVSLSREGGAPGASAQAYVIAPSLSARIETSERSSLLLGARADAWRANGISASGGGIQTIDLSPRVAYLQQFGRRKEGGPAATLKVGAGRFTDWPRLNAWSGAWASGNEVREVCSGVGVPAIDFSDPAPGCTSAASVLNIAGIRAGDDLRPAASNRADISLSVTEILPGVRGEIGMAMARASRISGILSPLANAPVAGQLSGEDSRALLVPSSSIGADGVVPVAEVPVGMSSAETLISQGSSSAIQWRLRLATRDPFSRLKLDATYAYTTGHERSLSVAAPTTAPGYLSGPLSTGRHTLAVAAGIWLGPAEVRFSAMARSGARFTPLADRDLNGDGRVNDAAFIPEAMADSWADAVAPSLRDCVRRASGRIAGINSCTGPWSVQSRIAARIPGAIIGLPRGSELAAQILNPLGLLSKRDEHPGVTFGYAAPVDPTLLSITGFDSAAQRFTAVPLSHFGTPVGVSRGLTRPMSLIVSLHIPVGPSVATQRADAALAMLVRDTSARGKQGAAMTFLGDVPPLPALVIRSGDALGLTQEQRKALQELVARWFGTATQIVSSAYEPGETDGAISEDAMRSRLVESRSEFFAQVLEIAAEIRRIVSADQIELLPESVQRLLNPRFLRFIAEQDAGEF